MAQPSLPNPSYWDTEKDIAFLFGAGASMPHLLPQGELIPALLKANQPRLRPAQTYLKRVFPGLFINNAPPVAYENVVGPLEIAETTQNWFHSVPRERHEDSFVTNQAVLHSFDPCLAHALDPDPQVTPSPTQRSFKTRCSSTAHSTIQQRGGTTYARLVHFLQTKLLEDTAFLSMNHDLLLDRCLNFLPNHAPTIRSTSFSTEPHSPPRRPSRF